MDTEELKEWINKIVHVVLKYPEDIKTISIFKKQKYYFGKTFNQIHFSILDEISYTIFELWGQTLEKTPKRIRQNKVCEDLREIEHYLNFKTDKYPEEIFNIHFEWVDIMVKELLKSKNSEVIVVNLELPLEDWINT